MTEQSKITYIKENANKRLTQVLRVNFDSNNMFWNFNNNNTFVNFNNNNIFGVPGTLNVTNSL